MAQETGPWTEYQPTAPADDGPWSEYAPVPEKKPGIARKAADLGLSVAKGVVGVPEAAVGLADIVSGGRTGKFLENEGGTVGFRPKQAKEYLGSLQSDALQGQKQEFADADGILDKTGVALTNPALIANTVAESVPLMLGGGAVARGAGKVAPSIAGRVGTTAAGEGAVMAGSQAEQIRQETEDGLLTPKQAALAAGTGVIGAGLGVAGARAARALGVGDVDQMIAQGVTQGVARPGLGIANRAGRGALTEGVFEELPQSLAETGLQNIALDRPVTEGMTDAAVLGTLAGGAMGGGAGVVSGLGQSRQPGQPEAEPFTPAPEMAADPLTGEVAAPPQEQATAGLPVDSEQVSAPAAAPLPDAEITDITPIRETQTPSQAMGIDPNAGSLSKAAATAVDTGVSQEMQAQQAAKEMAKAEQEAAKVAARQRPKAESPGIDKSALETRTDEELRGFLRSAQNADVRKAVSAELAKRKQAAIDAMPDPLQPSLLDQPELPTGEPARVAETAQAVQSRQEEPPAPAAQPAGELKPPRGILAKKAEREALGRPLTDTGAGVLGSPADPLQAVIQGENDARRATQTAPETTTEPAPADAGSSSPVPQADQPATGPLTRPPRWRNNALQAGKVARDMGLDPKGKKLPEILAEIDAVDAGTNVQNPPQRTAGTEAQAPAVEAPAPEGGDAAAAAGVPAAGQDAGVRADGVKVKKQAGPESVRLVVRRDIVGDKFELQGKSGDGEWEKQTTFDTDADARSALKSMGYDADSVETLVSDWIAKAKRFSPPKPAETGAGDGQADGVKAEGIAEAANQAATSPNNDLPQPTEAQKEAGNYSKGHVTINGHGISIENPAGSRRRPEWPPLKNHYGYFKGSTGADTDHVDVFLTGRADDPSLPVFVVDQVNRDGSFDEHKIIMGTANEAEARETYLQNYEKGWTGLGAITQMSQEDFKSWVRDPAKTKKPVALKRGVLAKMAEQKAKAEPTQPPAAEQKPTSKTPTVDRHNELMKAVRDGKATAEQFKSSFEEVVANKPAIVAELSTKTKAQLLAELNGWHQQRYANENKAEVVDALYRDMVGEYVLGESLSYGMGKGAYEAAVRAKVESTDADKLDRYVEDRRAAIAEAMENRKARAAAMENPQTLDDFRSVVKARMMEGQSRKEAFLSLTPEQRIKYDELEAESTREARETSKRAQKTEVRAAGQTTGGEIIATKHTKTGADLYVVQLSDRLSREDYTTVLASAKRMGGWYSSFRGNGAVPGFQFKTRDAADAFLKLAGGDTTDAKAQAEQRRDAFADDRSQSAVERLNEMAEKIEASAQEDLNRDRKTNTARRARFAASAERAAEAEKALARTMRNIAQAIDSGKAKFLDAVRMKTQVEALTGYVRTAKDNELRAKYPAYADQEKRRGEPPTAETADFAEFPTFTAFRSDLASLARQMIEVEGTKKLGTQLMKLADDVTDAYIEFAKQPENLQRLSTFSYKRGDDVKTAIFASRDTAEQAIKRSGLTGKAIVLVEKRGVNRVIMSPSEAMNQRIWDGDGDKRISLSAESGNTLVEAIGRRGDKKNGLTVPWQFQTAYDRRKALARMGIETPSEFRSALREFIALQERATANKVREMELAMVGKKSDGLDFFPTPQDVADQMVEAADIQPDMAVLEPSAGMGHIADRIRAAGAEPDLVELSPERRELLLEKGYHLAEVDDFTAMQPRKFFTYGDVFRAPDGTEGIMRGVGHMGSQRVRLEDEHGNRLGLYDRHELKGIGHRGTWSGYDRIIMNPPFSNRQDAEHVQHAYTLLKPGGRVVAIMGEGVFFGKDKKAQDFREWMDSVGGTDEKLPAGSFMDPSLPVNTGVSARMVVIDKPEGDTQLRMADPTQRATPSATSTATQANQAIVQSLSDSINAKRATKGSPAVNFQAVEPAEGTEGQLARAIAKTAKRIFNREVVYVRFDGQPLFNGAVSKLYPGKIFINIDSERPMMAVLGHELLHELAKSNPGTYANLSRRLDRVMRNQNIYSERLKAKYRTQGQPLPADIMEELEADIVGDNFMDPLFWQEMSQEQPGLFRAMANQIIRWLDKVAGQIRRMNPFGTEQYLTDIAAARSAVAEAMREFSRNQVTIPADALSIADRQDQTDTPAFKKWFGDSKVVDADGKPLVVYHGTRRGFNIFEPMKPRGARGNPVGIYFTSDRREAEQFAEDVDGATDEKSRVVEAYLSIKTEQDGVIRRRDDGTTEYIVFRPEQIKSATGNRGTFDPADPDIRFSIADTASRTADRVKAFNVKGKPANTLKHYRGMAMQALGRRQIVDLYANELPQLESYNDLVQSMDAEKNDMGAEADAVARDWGNLDSKTGVKGEELRLAELMHDATLAQIDPSKPLQPGDNLLRYAGLKSKYDKLHPESRALFNKSRDMYANHFAKVKQAIAERIERSDMSPSQKKKLMARMDDDFFKKTKGIYFPLARFGKYVVVVKDANGEVVSVNRAETINEANTTRDELLKVFPKQNGYAVGKVLKDKEYNPGRDAAGKGFMADLFEVLDKTNASAELKDSVGQLYLASLPDLSWAKHGIHRKGTPGFSQDARRAFAQNMFHGARHLAKLRYADRLQTELDAMQEHVEAYRDVEEYDSIKAQQVVDEMIKRHESLMSPQANAVSTALTSAGFVFFLGISPAAAMVNLSQTALVAYPIMGAKWGFTKSANALLRASRETIAAKNDISKALKGDELAAYEQAVKDGTIDVTMAHDLAGISQGEDEKVVWAMRPLMRWASFLFHHAERFNRQATFLASYRLAKESGRSNDEAFRDAKQATYDGHFDYGAANRPRLMQGNWAKVLLLFKQYAQNMVYTLSRQAYLSMKGMTQAERTQARKSLSGILALHAAAAGALGLPLVGPLLAAASFIGGDDDEPWDAEIAMKNMLSEAFGPKAAEVMAHGLSRLTPWDISSRVALNNLILPDIQEGLEGQRLSDAMAAAALGPVWGMFSGAVKGMGKIADGEYGRGLEDMLPVALRNPVKAVRYASEGSVDRSGVVIKDEVSIPGVLGQASGFAPSEVRAATERRRAIYDFDRARMERRSTLMAQFASARMAGDDAGIAEVREEIQRFNEKNPQRRITPVNLMQSVRARQRRIAQADEGVYLPKNRRDAVDSVTF